MENFNQESLESICVYGCKNQKPHNFEACERRQLENIHGPLYTYDGYVLIFFNKDYFANNVIS